MPKNIKIIEGISIPICIDCQEEICWYDDEFGEVTILCEDCASWYGSECSRKGYKKFIYLILELLADNK